MLGIERTAAGFQTVLPGCERRTLPKSTTRSDDVGQRRATEPWERVNVSGFFNCNFCCSDFELNNSD
jgi:hypothetical protein